ncbi:B12-binding domain-containing radical SAM protein [Ferruginibacter yonginensis]|uniref:B12-binding domain-containing radical SAM protein n=1 Tax=Ferruginibacter yonginensis TaxID=1310416 RepID=A0ABV8QTH3_9BACT
MQLKQRHIAAIYLITPPFTQLNTPYPATAYIKGFLNTKGISSFQSDLGIEVTLALFSKKGITAVFNHIEQKSITYSYNVQHIIQLKAHYINTIDAVIAFLQDKDPTLAHAICKRNFLPEASRFQHADDLEKAFGNMGIQDRAKFIATMYLEDLSDLIKDTVDENFGFSRYAERLGRSANTFDELYEALQQPYTFVDTLLIEILEQRLQTVNPIMVAISVPFPGNLYTSLRCGQYIKKHFPHIKVAMGGGFANTELRSVTDVRVFEFYDFITLDDGEAPLENLYAFVTKNKTVDELKRTFLLQDGQVTYINNTHVKDYKQGAVGTPDYSDLLLSEYISAIEVVNPMHRMWSDGRWNKLTMAHGCYWGKCTFCDVSLDYIKLYEPVAAGILCDRMETIMQQTGQNGFHFVDEAAPPALMRALAIEIINRKMVVTWWTNVRFEKSFTRDLCVLLSTAGCIAVSGGLEVASDRLLQLIDKGITVAQVAKVNRHFTEAGILVHAYLMYGFPTQTEQETIDSLEMVRQLFATNVLQSAFWHRFALTAHSPVGLNPSKYHIKILNEQPGSFANNDVEYEDETGCDHDSFGFGLKKSLFNYMHHIGIDEPLQKWFDFKIPKPKVSSTFIEDALNEPEINTLKPNSKIIFLGNIPTVSYFTQSKKGYSREMATLHFYNKRHIQKIQILKEQADWLLQLLPLLQIGDQPLLTLQDVMNNYEQQGLENFELFWDNKPMNTLYQSGLLQV